MLFDTTKYDLRIMGNKVQSHYCSREEVWKSRPENRPRSRLTLFYGPFNISLFPM